MRCIVKKKASNKQSSSKIYPFSELKQVRDDKKGALETFFLSIPLEFSEDRVCSLQIQVFLEQCSTSSIEDNVIKALEEYLVLSIPQLIDLKPLEKKELAKLTVNVVYDEVNACFKDLCIEQKLSKEPEFLHNTSCHEVEAIFAALESEELSLEMLAQYLKLWGLDPFFEYLAQEDAVCSLQAKEKLFEAIIPTPQSKQDCFILIEHARKLSLFIADFRRRYHGSKHLKECESLLNVYKQGVHPRLLQKLPLNEAKDFIASCEEPLLLLDNCFFSKQIVNINNVALLINEACLSGKSAKELGKRIDHLREYLHSPSLKQRNISFNAVKIKDKIAKALTPVQLIAKAALSLQRLYDFSLFLKNFEKTELATSLPEFLFQIGDELSQEKFELCLDYICSDWAKDQNTAQKTLNYLDGVIDYLNQDKPTQKALVRRLKNYSSKFRKTIN